MSRETKKVSKWAPVATPTDESDVKTAASGTGPAIVASPIVVPIVSATAADQAIKNLQHAALATASQTKTSPATAVTAATPNTFGNSLSLIGATLKDPLTQDEFFDLLKCFQILSSLSDKQKLWTTSEKYKLEISHGSLKDSLYRTMCGQSREKNLQDLVWIFAQAKKKLNYELSLYENFHQYIQTKGLTNYVDKLLTQAKQKNLGSVYTPTTYASVVSKSLNSVASQNATLDRKLILDITNNISTIDKIKDGINGSKKGLDMLKDNPDYKTSPEMQASLNILKGDMDSILDSLKTNVEYFDGWKQFA